MLSQVSLRLSARKQAAEDFAGASFPHLEDQPAQLFAAHHVPIQGRQDFQQKLLAAHLEGALVNLGPDARAGLIHVAALGGRAAARAVADPFRAFHRADKGRLLQQAVAALAAAPQRAFVQHLYAVQETIKPFFPFERIINWLPTASWG